jgi:hypothetical protein
MTYQLPDFKTQRITKRLDLAGYADSLAGNYVSVWLNTDEGFTTLYREYQQASEAAEQLREAADDGFLDAAERVIELAFELYSRLWSVPVEKVREMWAAAPGLYTWIAAEAWKLRADYNGMRAKKGRS